jgi:hypothetical protein
VIITLAVDTAFKYMTVSPFADLEAKPVGKRGMLPCPVFRNVP